MANLNITADNAPKDSGNRYMVAPFDPAGSAFRLMMGYPVSGDFAGLAIGHAVHHIVDTMTSTGGRSSGVDLGGWTNRGLFVPRMGSGCEIYFLVSGSAMDWLILADARGVAISATGRSDSPVPMSQSALNHLSPFRWVQISATQNQTANRTFVWTVTT